jgi:hypothetical protein
MLFILVMDVLNSLFVKVDSDGLLSTLLSTGQRLSLYADDVALFISSNGQDLQLTKNILQAFREASGLQTNLQGPIRVGRRRGREEPRAGST